MSGPEPTMRDPISSSPEWRDGWATGQVEGACSAASELLDATDPAAAAANVLADLERRFGARATKVGAFRDLRARLEPLEEGTGS